MSPKSRIGAFIGASLLLGCTGPEGDPGPAGQRTVGAPGDQGPTGDPASPSISAITPDRVFLARTVELLISGSGTDWTDQAVVELDTVNAADEKDVVVHGVVRASPTALVVEVEVTAEATLGLRDITVTDQGITTRFEGVFSVAAPLQPNFYDYQPFQGSVFPVYLDQTDYTTPFEPRFTRCFIEGGTKMGASVYGPYQAIGFFAIDVLQPPVATDLIVETGPWNDRIQSILPDGIQVKERLPQVIDTNQATLTIGGWDTRLLAFDLSAGQLVTFTMAATNPGAGFEIHTLGPSGRYATNTDYGYQLYDDIAPTLQVYAPTDGRHYMTLRHFGGAVPYDVEIDIDRQAKVPIGVTPPETIQRPIIVGVDADVFEVQAEAGQLVRAVIGDGATDTCGPAGNINAEMDIYDAEGNWVAGSWHPTESLCTSAAVEVEETGTYTIRVSPSLHGPYAWETPDQWMCVPLSMTLCGFDYSLTVSVE